jgi:hypothetical protein
LSNNSLKSSVGDYQLANRKGFLVGMTLAEIMLITLFVLLLLFKDSDDTATQFEDIEEKLGERATLLIAESDLKLNPDSQIKLYEIWETLINAQDVQNMGVEPPTESKVNDLQREIKRLQQQAEVLKGVVSKAGETVICTYKEPRPGREELHGPSVALGSVLVQTDGITLLSKNRAISNFRMVDYVGETYDPSEAVRLLNAWPMNVKLSYDEYRPMAKKIFDVGNIEVDKRSACRFTLNYYIDPEGYPEIAKIFIEQFERYFYRQQALSEERFQLLLEDKKNDDSNGFTYSRDDYQFRSYKSTESVGFYTQKVCSSVDIDHVVSLSDAHKSGGFNWNPAQKKLFANDRNNHVSSCSSINRSKGSSSPKEFLANSSDERGKDYKIVRFCDYVQKYYSVKQKYGLSIEDNNLAIAELCGIGDKPIYGSE